MGNRDIGLWAERLTLHSFADRPGLFLDRDGVVVEECRYLRNVEDIALIPDVAAEIAAANRAGVPVVLVTNQAGIGRGYYDWAAFAAVQRAILAHLSEYGADLDLVLACAYHADGLGPLKVADHAWRKPNSGMLQEAQRLLDIDLGRSFIVGDKLSDLRAGMAAGLPQGALVLTGHGAAEYAEHGAVLEEWRAESNFAVEVAENAAVAIRGWLDELRTI